MNTRIETINGETLTNNAPYVHQLTQAATVVVDTGQDGGGTFMLVDSGHAVNIDVEGYAVGGALDTVKISLDKRPVEQQDAIARFIGLIPRGGNGRKMHYLGTWIEDGYVWVDAVDIIEDEEEAFDLARKRGEIAVYHGPSDTVINVKDYYDQQDKALSVAEDRIERELSRVSEDVPA